MDYFHFCNNVLNLCRASLLLEVDHHLHGWFCPNLHAPHHKSQLKCKVHVIRAAHSNLLHSKCHDIKLWYSNFNLSQTFSLCLSDNKMSKRHNRRAPKEGSEQNINRSFLQGCIKLQKILFLINAVLLNILFLKKNPENKLLEHNCFQHWKYHKFLEQQISIL